MKPLPRFGVRNLALGAVALLLAVRPSGPTADAAPSGESGALDFVPADAYQVVSVHVADLWKHPAGKALRDKLVDGLPDAVKEFRGAFGVGPDQLDRLTSFELLPEPGRPSGPTGPLTAVTTLQPYDQKAVLAAAAPDAREQKVKERTLYVRDRGPSFAFLDDHTFVLGQPEPLRAFLTRPPGKTQGPLAPALRLADKHLAAAGFDVAAVLRVSPPPAELPPDFQPFQPLFKAQVATLTVDLDDKLRAAAQVTFATEADAKEGMVAVYAALDMARQGFGPALKEMADAPKATALLKDVQEALRTAKPERKGTKVQVEAALPIETEATAAALTEGVEKIRKMAKRMQMTNDLKQLALGAHSYHDAIGELPPAAIADKNGKPLLSWRVALLPYIGEDSLYKEFHLDEPWDSDHNKKLLEKMPATFAPPDSAAFKNHETHFQGFVGKDSVFDGTKVTLVTITDGTSQTIMFVEAKKAVPWTKPEDVTFDAGKLLPKVGGLSEGGFLAAMCDGSVHFFRATIREETLRALVTRSGGEVIDDTDQ